jgi:ABC-type sulfate/molybdate transport systems ATPase subunit
MLCGLEKTDSGQVIAPEHCRFGYSFQDVRLLPWLTISENVAYALSAKHVHKQEISNRVAFLLENMELSHHAHKYPHQLSGGQQQRVGLARALAVQSDVLLLDEPMTGLDNELKIRIIGVLSEWFSVYKPLVIWATHEDIQMQALETVEVQIS